MRRGVKCERRVIRSVKHNVKCGRRDACSDVVEGSTGNMSRFERQICQALSLVSVVLYKA